MVTFDASMVRLPLMSYPSMTVPDFVIVYGPVYDFSTTPAGTPVFAAVGQAPEADVDAVLALDAPDDPAPDEDRDGAGDAALAGGSAGPVEGLALSCGDDVGSADPTAPPL
jgi:hypothetical protein